MEVNKNFIMLLAYLCLSHILTNIRGYGVLYMLDISEVGSGSYQLLVRALEAIFMELLKDSFYIEYL